MLGLAGLLVLALRFHRLAELAWGMRHTTHMGELIIPHHLIVAVIAIGLQITPESFQQSRRHCLAPRGIIVIQDNRMFGGSTALQPQLRLGLGRFTRFVEYLHRDMS
jgi:hypothetical protein